MDELDPEHRTVAVAIATGMGWEQAAQVIGSSRPALYRYADSHPAFREAIGTYRTELQEQVQGRLEGLALQAAEVIGHAVTRDEMVTQQQVKTSLEVLTRILGKPAQGVNLGVEAVSPDGTAIRIVVSTKPGPAPGAQR